MDYRRGDDRGGYGGGRRDDNRGGGYGGGSRDYDRGGKGYGGGGKGGYDDRDRGGGFNSFDRDRGGGKGGGSSYRDYQGSRNSGKGYGGRGGGKGRSEADGPRQKGIVATVKDNFGFIECEERDERLFFHFTEIEDTRHCPKNGDCVEFGICSSRGKTSACQIEILPAGSVKLEEELEGRFEGVVVTELKGGRPQDAHGGQIQVTSGSSEAEGSEPDPDDLVMFNGVDLASHRHQPFVGDKVELTIVKKLGKKRGRKVVITAPGGDGRQQGTISTIKDSFGFVECCDSPERLFFHFSELFDNVDPRDLKMNQEVEFNVVPSDRHGQDNCSRVKLLPKGTVSFETELPGRRRGKITKELRAPPRNNRNNRSHDDRNGRPEQKATGRITLDDEESNEEPAAESDAESDAEPAAEPSDEPAPGEAENASKPKGKKGKGPKGVTFEASGIAEDEGKLIVGDTVELTLVINKRTGQEQATKINLIAPNPNRERGIVVAIRDRGEAHIRCADRAERVTCLAHDGEPLRVGDCVEFNVLDASGGNRLFAARPDLLPEGSVVLDEVLEGRQKGKIIKLDMAREDKWSSRASEVATGGQIEISEGPEGLPKCVSFVTSDSPKVDAGALGVGDIVDFKIMKEILTGKVQVQELKQLEMAGDMREQGIVATVKEQNNFGFIKCADRDIRIFFHFSEWRGERMLREGDEVEFNSTSRDGKETATRLVMLPKGSIVFEIPLEGRFIGKVITEAKRGGGKGYGGKGGGKGGSEGGVPGIISVDAEAIEKQKAALLGQAESTDEPAAEEAASENPLITPPPAEEVAEPAAAEEAPPAEPADGEASEAPEARQMQIKFRLEDVEDRATPYCRDQVEFSLVLVKRNNSLQAKRLKVLPKAGRVTNMRGRSGFIQHKGFSASGEPEIMDTSFYMDDVMDDVVLKSSDEVEFIVCFDQRQKCSKCINIKRTKEAPASERPERSRMQLAKKLVATGSTMSQGPVKDSDGHSLIGFAFGSYGRMRKEKAVPTLVEELQGKQCEDGDEGEDEAEVAEVAEQGDVDSVEAEVAAEPAEE